MRLRLRGALSELTRLVLAAAIVAIAAAPVAAATPAPAPTKTPIYVKRALPTPKPWVGKLHTEFLVEINKLGQVTRVRSGKSSSNLQFNAETYGNALQAFIRTDTGNVVLGTYKLSYNYDPTAKKIHRDVELVSRGGVDPNAKGAVIDMAEKAQKSAAKTTPNPNASYKPLPGNFDQVVKPSPNGKG